MKECPTCKSPVKEPLDDVKRDVFVWTFMVVLFGGITIFNSEWSLVWWRARFHVLFIVLVLPVVATYYWVRFFTLRKGR